jgi:hypothetical protein
VSDPPEKYLSCSHVRFEDLNDPELARDDLLVKAERIAIHRKNCPHCRVSESDGKITARLVGNRGR